MKLSNQFLPLFLLFLALTAPSLSADTADPTAPKPQPRPQTEARAEDDPYAARFEELDRDNNGAISRAEWPLDPQSFDIVDRNKDGHLSRTELLTPNVSPDGLLDRQFRELDTNLDGRLSAYERRRVGDALERLDRNRDGYIVRDELRTPIWRETREYLNVYPQQQSRFHFLDRNQDGLLNRLEWTGSRDIFNRLDRNRDGFVSLHELNRGR
jgi:Ca2+-binding EF-hand superfamily protein